jgi:hypothetical protein
MMFPILPDDYFHAQTTPIEWVWMILAISGFAIKLYLTVLIRRHVSEERARIGHISFVAWAFYVHMRFMLGILLLNVGAAAWGIMYRNGEQSFGMAMFGALLSLACSGHAFLARRFWTILGQGKDHSEPNMKLPVKIETTITATKVETTVKEEPQ